MKTTKTAAPQMATLTAPGSSELLLDEDGEPLRVPMDRPSTITWTPLGCVATWEGLPRPKPPKARRKHP